MLYVDLVHACIFWFQSNPDYSRNRRHLTWSLIPQLRAQSKFFLLQISISQVYKNKGRKKKIHCENKSLRDMLAISWIVRAKLIAIFIMIAGKFPVWISQWVLKTQKTRHPEKREMRVSRTGQPNDSSKNSKLKPYNNCKLCFSANAQLTRNL